MDMFRKLEISKNDSSRDKYNCGVGFVIKDNILPNIVNFKPISNRLCYIELKCIWYNVLLINCYAPTKDKCADIKNKFYEDLKTCYVIPYRLKKLKIGLGYFNTKIGRKIIYKPTIGSKSLYEVLNDQGNKRIVRHTKNCELE